MRIARRVAATVLVAAATVVATAAGTSGATGGDVAAGGDVAPPVERRIIGTSVEGRPIEALRLGTPGGTVVLVVGVIHGDEDAGLAIVDELARRAVPRGVELWIVPSMNPDGVAARRRGNARLVDLNRNFPHAWARMGRPGYWQYAGPSRASEPETRAMVAFVREIRPALGIWYHQDLSMISPGTGDEGSVRARYAALTGLPLVRITGGRYTGVAATWQRRAVPDGMAMVVELGPTLPAAEAVVHADAVMAVARMTRDLRG